MRIPPHTVKTIHFIGIGGIGMSGIAEVLHNLGYEVRGSDIAENANVQRLRQKGIIVKIGHEASNVQGAQVVVVSSDIKSGNIELQTARDQRIPVIRRAEMLAELMRFKLSVAVSGTHGKTTTTSLMAALFDAAFLDATVVNGGIINAYGTNARLGKGEWIIVEADESDGSFTRLPATIAVVTNIDPEHMDFYPSFAHLKKAFIDFVERIPFYGLGIMCIDHPEVRALLPELLDRRIMTYGFCEDANVRATNMRQTAEGTTFDADITTPTALAHRALAQGAITVLPRKIKDLYLPMVGQHNVQNALAVIALAQELNLDDAVVRSAFAGFSGVKRRFTKTGSGAGITVIDDYAHHPVEIKTVLAAARQATKGRIVVVAQPHRYSRLHYFFSDFVSCFEGADALIVAPVYGAGEAPIEGATSSHLVKAIQASSSFKVHELTDSEDLASLAYSLFSGGPKEGDMILCVGAGTITQWAAALPVQLNTLEVPLKVAN
ncbi:MAG: UDP-N-acetylmuramate--L-alanine ligase [Alphaproteobacteria bacterium]|nr:UDP-N-acetylmuramate--L-alanine ligase [Alphaproteobacteria bacterium]